MAQRVSTIKHADQIVVLNNGKIVGKGTHFELLTKCKVYQEIVKSQLSDAEYVRELKLAGQETGKKRKERAIAAASRVERRANV